MSARLDAEVLQHLVQMHRELLLRENAAAVSGESRLLAADDFQDEFTDEETLPPRRLLLRVF